MNLFYNRNLFFAALLAVMAGFAFPAPAVAAQTEIIVILDLGKVLSNSKALADVNKQIKTLEEDFRLQGSQREKLLREEQDALNRQRVILPPKTFEQKKKAFNQKALSFRNEMQSKLKQLALSRSAAINKIEQAMEPIVSEIAKSFGATVILEKKQILFGVKELDISDRVAEVLNTKLTNVPVTLVALPKK